MSKWIRANDSDGIDLLADVDTSTAAPVATNHLEFDGTNWVPVAAPTGGGGAVAGLGNLEVNDEAASQATAPSNINLGTFTASSVSDIRFDAVTNDALDVSDTLLAHLKKDTTIILRAVDNETRVATYTCSADSTRPAATTDTRVSVTYVDSTFTTFTNNEDFEVAILAKSAASKLILTNSFTHTLEGHTGSTPSLYVFGASGSAGGWNSFELNYDTTTNYSTSVAHAIDYLGPMIPAAATLQKITLNGIQDSTETVTGYIHLSRVNENGATAPTTDVFSSIDIVNGYSFITFNADTWTETSWDASGDGNAAFAAGDRFGLAVGTKATAAHSGTLRFTLGLEFSLD